MSGRLPVAARAPRIDRIEFVADAAAAMDRWLLDGPAQRSDGAVAGWLGANDVAAYVYPEIAGYYLQWLASRARDGVPCDTLAARASATERWLAEWLSARTPPLTRIHTDTTVDDWRNRAVFCFDLAMVLRGLAAAATCGLIARDEALIARVCDQLDAMIDGDGELVAVRVHAPGPAFPDRWSTRRGPFLAKAAAGILFATDALESVPARLRESAERTFVASLRALRDEPHAETHPLLYAIEGWLDRPTHAAFAAELPTIASCYGRIVARSAAIDRVPEADDAPGQPRLDIVAQALRAGVLLAHHARTSSFDPFLAELEGTLVDAITRDGAIPFVRDAVPQQRNTWTTMFASQALAWRQLDADGVAAVAAQPLIV